MARYHSVSTTIDDIRFASQLEAQRYLYLRQCREDGMISELNADKRLLRKEFSESVRLVENAMRPKTRKLRSLYYEADFMYRLVGSDSLEYEIWEDCKGAYGNSVANRLKGIVGKPIVNAKSQFKMNLFKARNVSLPRVILRICTIPTLDPKQVKGYFY